MIKRTELRIVGLLGLLICGSAVADDGLIAKANPAARVQDVALLDGGILQGQYLTSSGGPIADSKTVLVQDGKVLAIAKTNQHGQFAFTVPHAGVYQVVTSQDAGVYRLWAPRTAPPTATRGILLHASENVVRGQGSSDYGPAIRGAVAGGLLTGFTYWALDYNAPGS